MSDFVKGWGSKVYRPHCKVDTPFPPFCLGIRRVVGVFLSRGVVEGIRFVVER